MKSDQGKPRKQFKSFNNNFSGGFKGKKKEEPVNA